MRYFFIIGERSGDLHASNLIKAIKNEDAAAEVLGIGGELSQAAGMELIHHYKELSIVGLTKVLTHLRTIKKNFALCKDALQTSKPDAVVLVDFPGFNLRMAKYAKELSLPVYYYIAPKVWASRTKRVNQIKAYVDKVFTILPFENKFFAKHKVDFEYVGNPLLDEITKLKATLLDHSTFCEKYALDDKPIIALLAGSRKQEVKKLLPLMLKMRQEFPGYQFVLAGVDNLGDELYHQVAGDSLPPIVYNDTYSLLNAAKVAIVASGTATLETALLRIPQVVCYDFGGGRFIHDLYFHFMKVDQVSLVNLTRNKRVVRELLQHHYNYTNLLQELKLILNNESYRSNMLQEYDAIIKELGGAGASKQAAQSIIRDLRTR